MKKTLLYTLALFLLAACSEEEIPVGFSLDKTELTVGADGAMEALSVVTDAAWSASCDQPWVTLSPANGIGSQECHVSIDSTLTNDVRTATIRFTADGHTPQIFTIHQTGYGHIIHPDSTLLHIKAAEHPKDNRRFELKVTTNVAFDVTVQYTEGGKPWITPHETEITLDRGARPRTATLCFDWDNNTVPEAREAILVFTPKDPAQTLDVPAAVTIMQAAAQRIEDNRAGDSLAIIAIAEELNLYTLWDTSENMQHWDDVRLWERSDKDLPCPEAVGRVRDVRFFLCNTTEQLPVEVKYLKYAESLSFFSNVNSFLKDFELGSEVCSLKHLRSLEVFAFGLTDLPEELTQLGSTLECLRIGGNNFNQIPAVLTQENFPKLRILEMQACRRWPTSDLRDSNDASKYEGGIGLHFNTKDNDALKRLLLWDTLEELVLSYNYIEGQIPDFEPGKDGVEAWSQQDVDEWGGDTIQYLADHHIPKILPKAKRLTLNLNFFTGALPNWLLHHPHLLDWIPEQLIFNQMEYGLNSEGQSVRFNNEPKSFEYYYQAFPKYRDKYEIKEERED